MKEVDLLARMNVEPDWSKYVGTHKRERVEPNPIDLPKNKDCRLIKILEFFKESLEKHKRLYEMLGGK